FSISSLVASGRMKRVEPMVSSSTTLVILTLPTFHCIRVPSATILGGKMRVSALPCNGSNEADGVIGPDQGAGRCRNSRSCLKNCLPDREGTRIRREGGSLRSRLRVERRG